MNVRIKALAEAATDNIMSVKVLDQNKFAQLIIQDCIEQIDKTIEALRMTDQNEAVVGCQFAKTHIKYHFRE